MKPFFQSRLLWVFLFVLTSMVPLGSTQDSLDTARDLYAAAAYDEALAMLERLHANAPELPLAEIEQERALCLLALNRVGEAEQAIATVVQAQPLYLPDESVVAPRIRAAFQDVRDRLAPEIARSYFARGRDSFERGDHERALASFDVVIELVGDRPHLDASLRDLELLAHGFRKLSEASLAPEDGGATGEASAESAAPEAELRVDRIFDLTTPGVSPPVTLRQDVPEWRPSMGRPPSVQGVMAITINEQGIVEDAEIIRSLHTAYDRLLLAAANGWAYQPASRDGAPVKFRKIIRLALR